MTGLIIDNFAGGGGASTALEAAFGRKVDIAINHDAKALAMHKANHPETRHMQEDVFDVDPFEVCAGRPIDAAWFSPDCKHFSRAKGGKPVEKRIRGLAWVVLRWASLPDWQRPKVIFLENVEEFLTWGPLLPDGKPDPAKSGTTFRIWLGKLKARGYVVDWRIIKACDFGAPTIRKRLFLVARRDGNPIVWPAATHMDPKKARPPAIRVKLTPYRTAAEIIDWSIPCQSIFGRKKPLAENTLRRIARGVMRYVVENPTPFIVRVTQSSNLAPVDLNAALPTITTAKGGELALVAPSIIHVAHGDSGGRREYPIDDALGTITSRGNAHALIAPVLSGCGGRAAQSQPYAPDRPMNTLTTKADQIVVAAHLNINRNSQKPWQGADEPTHTICAEGAHLNVVSAFLAQHNNHRGTIPSTGRPVDAPMSTIVGKGCTQAVVAAHLLNLKGSDRRDQPIDMPAPAITAGGWHVAEVRAFLLSYYGASEDAVAIDGPLHTVTTRDRFGLVMVHGEPFEIVDIGMRMLSPRELFDAQGFPSDYVIDVIHNGRPLTKSDQIAKVGNSVSPPPATAIAIANAPPLSRLEYGAARKRRRAA